jgi:hypothetical protein
MKKDIHYYGSEDNYIHLKFGDCVKAYNFTDAFRTQYPQFTQAYENYWDGKRDAFKNALQVITYIYNNKIPVHLYFNFTDTPVKNRKEAVQYFIRENNKDTIYKWELPKA